MHHIESESLNQLFDAILALKDREECSKFFEDICTIKEIQDISQRLEVAQMLSQGISYTTICKETGASTATISRVSRAYNYGDDGYKNIIAKMKGTEK